MHQYQNYCFPTQLCMCAHTHTVASPESHKQQHVDSTVCLSSVEFEKQTLHKRTVPWIQSTSARDLTQRSSKRLDSFQSWRQGKGGMGKSCACAYVLMAALRNAGFESRRCRFQVSPSLTRRPFPARLLPGKKAVPAYHHHHHHSHHHS